LKNSTNAMQNNKKLAAEIKRAQNNDAIANAVMAVCPNLPDDYPVAYAAGRWFFYGLPFFVNENVLVPRFDTEVLAAEAIKIIQSAGSQPNRKQLNVLDLCTGSGCIAAAIAKHTNAYVTAVDISEAALEVAHKNSLANGVRIRFLHGNLFEALDPQNSTVSAEHGIHPNKFNLIVCNPPYIKTAELGKHDKSILAEPQIALDGGRDGLDFYRRIIEKAADYLCVGGFLALEVGYNQANECKNLLNAAGFSDINIVKDKGGHDRVVICRKN